MLGIFADAIDEVRKLPPAGKVLVVGALGVGIFVMVAHARSSSSGSGASTDAGTTAASSTDNGTWGVAIPGVNPGTTTTTSGAPSSAPQTTPSFLANLFKLTVNSQGQEQVTTPGGYTLSQIAQLFGDKADAEYYSGANSSIRSEIQKANPGGGATKYNGVVLKKGDVITLTPNALGVTMSN